jgi:hypothetical protein
MRRLVCVLAAGGAVVLGAALVYRAVCPAPKPPPAATIHGSPSDATGPTDEATWRYRLCQPRHWRYLLLNN